MNVPNEPVYTGNVDQDIVILKGFITDLVAYLIYLERDNTFTVGSFTADYDIAVGDTLTNTQHFLCTVVQALKDKGIL